MTAIVTPVVLAEEREEVRSYLLQQYAGVFGPAEIEFHLDAHLGYGFADYACQVIATALPAGSRVLDVGAGFGSFVTLARLRGFDAIGTEIAPVEVGFSRRRLARERPSDDAARVFLDGGIFNGDLDRQVFDAITFWNVLEHIADVRPILERARRLLRSGGAIYVVCPNYAAWRNEAHYQVPWHPLLSRDAAIRRLRSFGKDPRFFETSVFPITNWRVMRELMRLGFVLYDRLNQHAMWPGHGMTLLARQPAQVIDYFNPFRPSVELAARKRD
jgi:MPBQ/MSBQ methyltransferase